MKVKIKKQGKVKEFKLINKWSEVTLSKWLKLIDFHNGSKSSEATETIAALSDIPKKLIKQLELKDVAVIMGRVAELQQKQNSSLKRIIEVEGKEYGFHPDLDSITLGEYADIETFIKNGIEKHLPELMAILYRPITERGENGVYTIAAYDGNIRIRAEQMKKMSAEQVQSALVFFYHLGNVLLTTLPSYLMERLKEMKMQSQQNPSQKSGDGLE
tara:strand:+ start:1117 stop:1761 length:645 start_codon:yes stop_codon:yes gene_type:complete